MRATAFEELCRRLELAVEHSSDDPVTLALAVKQLAAKSRILRSRNNDASVIRELMNGRPN